MQQLIEHIKQKQLSESEQPDHTKWKLLKFEICKFAITYSEKTSQNTRKSQFELEKKLKEFESNLNSEVNFNEITKCKNNLELIYDKIAEDIKIRSKCQRFEEDEKST